MKFGISTASMFKRMYNEESLPLFNANGVETAEVFLGTFSEYGEDFAQLLNKNKGKIEIHSVHTLNTHFEPQLFSDNARAVADAYKVADNVLKSAKLLGAKNWTFHGQARLKKDVTYTNYEKIGAKFQTLTDYCKQYDVNLALENVEWAFYNKPGFFREVKKYCPDLKCTLDTKQARVSGFNYVDYLSEMAGSLETVHISDFTADGKVCLPQKGGQEDFSLLFSRLKDIGYDGTVLIEVYYESFKETDELFRSLDYVRNLVK